MANELIERPEYEVGQLADVGAGTEDFSGDTLLLPYIKLIQSNSPEMDPGMPEYNPDARPGYFVNGATGLLYGSSIDIVAARFARRINEWAPRNAGGGLKGVYSVQDAPTDGKEVVVDGRKRIARANGNFLEESYYYYALVSKPDALADGFDYGVLSFKSTGIKVAKRFNMTILSQRMRDENGKLVTKAIYSQIYRVKTLRMENSQGVWYGTVIARAAELDPSSDVYQAAKLFSETALGSKIQGEKSDGDEVETTGRETSF